PDYVKPERLPMAARLDPLIWSQLDRKVRACPALYLDAADGPLPVLVLGAEAANVEARAVVHLRDVGRFPALLALPHHDVFHCGSLYLLVAVHVGPCRLGRLDDGRPEVLDLAGSNDRDVLEGRELVVPSLLERLHVPSRVVASQLEILIA